MKYSVNKGRWKREKETEKPKKNKNGKKRKEIDGVKWRVLIEHGICVCVCYWNIRMRAQTSQFSFGMFNNTLCECFFPLSEFRSDRTGGAYVLKNLWSHVRFHSFSFSRAAAKLATFHHAIPFHLLFPRCQLMKYGRFIQSTFII